jgi:predicted transcriptional regulator
MLKDIRKVLEKNDENFLFVEKHFEKFEMFTEKRIELVRTIMHRRPGSIRELAELLHRDTKNVFDDLKILDNMGMVKFVRIGRKKQPVVRRKFVIISFE